MALYPSYLWNIILLKPRECFSWVTVTTYLISSFCIYWRFDVQFDSFGVKIVDDREILSFIKRKYPKYTLNNKCISVLVFVRFCIAFIKKVKSKKDINPNLLPWSYFCQMNLILNFWNWNNCQKVLGKFDSTGLLIFLRVQD